MKQTSPGRVERLLAGARQFRERVVPQRAARLAKLAEGQSPEALFIACADSRIVPELITQSDPGELFVCRNIGNIVPAYGEMLGGVSAVVEYAVAALGVKDIVVCGHSDCGAMKALCDPAAAGISTMPAVENWLRNAQAALGVVRATRGELSRAEMVQALVEQNVLLQLQHLRTHPAVAARLASGGLTLHGWVYGVGDGSIQVFDDEQGTLIPVEKAASRLARRSA
jgi:carbonic anhydrase